MKLENQYLPIRFAAIKNNCLSIFNHLGNKKNLLLILSLLLSISWANEALSQTEKYKAAYMYNFTNYLEWPTAYRSGNFVIGVLGSNAAILPELKAVAASRKVYGQTIEVKSYAAVSNINKCHILFIGDGQKNNIEAAVTSVGSNNTLIITDFSGAINRGSAINFVLVGGKLKFEMKKANAKNHGINVSADLERLAVKTY